MALLTAMIILPLGMLGVPGCSSQAPKKPPAQARLGAVPLEVKLTPATGAVNQPVTTEIGISVSGGQLASVTLATRAGQAVTGTMRPDGSTWVPDAPLKYGTGYTATVTASGEQGRTRTATTSFTTMAEPGGSRIGSSMYIFNGESYGVALPIAVEFDEEIPASARSAIQRRLFVSSTPPQVGAWRWYGGRQVIYRPREYWQPGTRVAVRLALGGLPVGHTFVDSDHDAVVTIGDRVEMRVSNATKQMYVYRNGALARTIPVSLGKASTPSSSGNMVIMTKAYQTIFDTTNEGPGGYRVSVNYAMRLTWGGEFIHAAPWSVYDQGVSNVSHGCVNMSTENAAWLFDIAHVGDPVSISGTEVKLASGNGWTSWDMGWAEYVAGGALTDLNPYWQAASPIQVRPGF